jgi:hypothetical protein
MQSNCLLSAELFVEAMKVLICDSSWYQITLIYALTVLLEDVCRFF